MEADLATRVDCSSTTVGRRYARVDEMGIPFTCTVDFETVKDNTVTMRERDSTQQIRLPIDDVTPLIYDFCHGRISWEGATQKYPIVEVKTDDDNNDKPAEVGPTVVESTSRGSFSRPSKSIL